MVDDRSASATRCSRPRSMRFKRTQNLDDPASIRDAISKMEYASIVGPINFTKGPYPEHVRDAARHRPVEEGQEVPVRSRQRRQHDRTEHPGGREDGADRPWLIDGDAIRRGSARGGGPMLQLTGVSRRFGGLRVIEELNLTVRPGRGARRARPQRRRQVDPVQPDRWRAAAERGCDLFMGRDVTTMKVWLRRRLGIGRTYQVPKPFAHMSVFENVLVAATHGGGLTIPAGRREAHEALALTGLAALAAKPARDALAARISSGSSSPRRLRPSRSSCCSMRSPAA